MVQQNYQGETTNSKNPLWDGNPPWGQRISAENLMAIGKSCNLKKRKMTKESNTDFWAHTEARKDFQATSEISFIVVILNWDVQLYVPREESYPIPLNYIDVKKRNLCRSGDCTKKRICDYWDVEICQGHGLDFIRFTLWSETLLKGYNQPGGRLMRKSSRPDHIWTDALTRIWESSLRKKETRIRNREAAIPCKRQCSRTCVRETVVPK